MLQALQGSDKILAFLDQYQHEKQKGSEDVVKSKPEVVVYDAKIQIVEEKSKVKAQDTEDKTKGENTNVEFANQVSDEPLEESVLITNKCHTAALVLVRQVNENQEPDKEKIQPIHIATPDQQLVVFLGNDDLVCDMPEVKDQVKTCASLQPIMVPSPIHGPKQKSDEV